VTGPAVCVIGGGIAGLAAAHRLATAGADVTILERDQLGGKIRTSSFAGRPVDEAADAFLPRVPWALDRATAVGLGDSLESPAVRSAHVFVQGALRPFPTEQVLGVPTDLDALAASGLISEAGLAAAHRDLVDTRPPPAADVAIGPYVRDRLGAEVVDRLVGPLVGGINAGDIDELSLAAVTPQLDAAARDPHERSLIRACAAMRARGGLLSAGGSGDTAPAPVFAAPRKGMGRLVDALAAELATLGVAVRLGTAANAIERRGDGWSVSTADGHAVEADALVLAAPARASAGLLTDLAPEASSFLGGIEHSSVALVTLAIDPDDIGRPLDGSGFLVPRSEELLITACTWSSAKWARLAPSAGDGTAVLRASVGRAGDTRFADLDDAQLIGRVVDDLTRTMALNGAPVEHRVNRWPRSFPKSAPGHLDRLAAAAAVVARRAPTVALAGAALRGVGIPACIHSGLTAADRVLAAVAVR
jgi:oxygen-dependent protoporphyrinogen oxidase